MTTPPPVRRPTRDEALDASAKVAARIWLGLTDDERAQIIAEADAVKADTRAAS